MRAWLARITLLALVQRAGAFGTGVAASAGGGKAARGGTFCDEWDVTAGGWTAECSLAFVRDFWQRRPLLVRGAFKNVGDLQRFDLDGLRELSLDEDVSSRLITRRLSGAGDEDAWELGIGPFTEEDFADHDAGAERWSLVVNDCDRCLPSSFAELLGHPLLRGLAPRWRVDDVQVSASPRGGGIGPHVDSYDVFLVQGRGERHWSVEDAYLTPDEECERLAGGDVRVLRDFRAAQEWTLAAGDVLYLPPRVPHRGITASDGVAMTFSVGFRAPSGVDLMSALLEEVYAAPGDGGPAMHLRYTDAPLEEPLEEGDAARITDAQVARAKALVMETLEEALRSPRDAARWFGRAATRPRRPAPFALEDVAGAASGDLVRAEAGTWCFWVAGEDDAELFVDGHAFRIRGPGAERAARTLCGSTRVPLKALLPDGLSDDGGIGGAVEALLREGWLRMED